MDEYIMPSDIRKLFTPEFVRQFKINLCDEFTDLEFANEEDWGGTAGTCGWYDAFKKTCKDNNLIPLLLYYEELEWYESDMFDSDVIDIAIEYGLTHRMEI